MFLFLPPLLSPRSSLLTVQPRQFCSAFRVREGAQGPSREELGQTTGPDFICARHPPVLLRGGVHQPAHRVLGGTAWHFHLTAVCCCVVLFQAVVKDLFSQFGSVRSVELKDHPGSSEEPGPRLSRLFRPAEKQGFKVGYVVFESPSSIAAAKSHPCDDPLVVSTQLRPVRTGVQKWIQQYIESFIPTDKLQQIVDAFMQDYDKRKEEEEERQKQEAEKQQEDEEGWVKVTRGHKGAKARPHSEAADQRTLQREKRKKRRKELLNFYTWQHRNTQKEHIAELRKKFEEDKQRIALMRAQRKFKPY
uniref:Ribosomal RNA processing 7 homolog A n=1 Tax=Kryptolebias marmoratus TaxID=37003 RepID=A0A3Q3B3J9_KRYMA